VTELLSGLRDRGLLVQQSSGRWARYQIATELKKTYQEKPYKKPLHEGLDTKSNGIMKKILAFCSVPRSAAEIAKHIQLHRVHLRTRYLPRLLKEGALRMTNPAHPTARNQKYVTAKKTL